MRSLIMSLVILGLGMLGPSPAGADIITEFGAGVKSPGTTSVLMRKECHLATIIETRPDTPGLDYRDASCGGDDPIFSGWPVAYQKDFGVWTLRAGWYHFSHWFDGKSDRELHMDCACITATFNWSEHGNRRAIRRNTNR